ncbi:MAG: hypothetical protein JSV81_03885 [Anaerolineales bacterium]|nr:MAG: hypothetical protein JSV81_03885 [Anaerolineales bacterium]
MELRQTPLTVQTPLPPAKETIPPSQVWACLNQDQKRYLLQTIVLVCQELTAPALHIQPKREATDE